MLRIDFETYSVVNLSKQGVDIYARHPLTDASLMAYGFDEEPVCVWSQGDPVPDRIRTHIENGGTVSAWNVAFELAIWNNIMVPRYGWPILTTVQCRCTMAASGAMSLPLGLDKCASALKLGIEKDKTGYALMLRMSRPRKIEGDKVIWWTDPRRLARLQKYCKQDVELERAISKKLRPLSDKEQALWVIDQQINQRGVPVDTENVNKLIIWCEAERDRLNKQMRKVTGGKVKTCADLTNLREFTNVKSVAKSSLDEALDEIEKRLDNRTPAREKKTREALMLRREYAKTSTKKLEAFQRGTMDDNRIRGIFQFNGAGSTGRWAGRRVQPQNFPRPLCSQDEIERRLDTFHLKSLQDVSDCLRGLIAAPEGEALVCADFSAIEARTLAWLANQQDILDVFREGKDLYTYTARDIYCIPDNENVTKYQRQIGKVATLALGYQGAKGAFKAMALNFGLDLPGRQVDQVVRLWRKTNKQIVNWWYDLERTALKALRSPEEAVKVGQLIFKYKKKHLWLQLPSGRLMCWPRARIATVTKPWGADKGIQYIGENSFTRKVETLTTFGGKLAENITQAVARDLLAEALVRIEKNGYPVVMHVHDEVVAMMPEGGSLTEFETIMATPPEWADNLPLAAEGWTGRRFRKG